MNSLSIALAIASLTIGVVVSLAKKYFLEVYPSQPPLTLLTSWIQPAGGLLESMEWHREASHGHDIYRAWNTDQTLELGMYVGFFPMYEPQPPFNYRSTMAGKTIWWNTGQAIKEEEPYYFWETRLKATSVWKHRPFELHVWVSSESEQVGLNAIRKLADLRFVISEDP